MKKLCFVGGDFRLGGSNVVSLNLAKSLCGSYEISFVSIMDVPENEWFFENRDERIDFFCLNIEKERIRDMRKKTRPAFLRYVEENGIDVVIAIGFYAAYMIAPLPGEKKGTRYFYWEHGSPASRFSDKQETLMRVINGRLFDRTIALTDSSRDTFVRRLFVPKKRAVTVYNWIDPRCLASEPDYDLSSRRVLTVGRMTEEKGFDMAVDIAEDFLSRCPGWEWHFMGDGPEREALENKVRADGFADRVRFLGVVPDAWQHYDGYAVMALTSYREGLPLVLLEGMARGLPCVSFDVVTGPNEIIREGENGYLVPMYDKCLFADRLEALACDDGLRRRFSDACPADFGKFDRDAILARWVSLIEEGSGRR